MKCRFCPCCVENSNEIDGYQPNGCFYGDYYLDNYCYEDKDGDWCCDKTKEEIEDEMAEYQENMSCEMNLLAEEMAKEYVDKLYAEKVSKEDYDKDGRILYRSEDISDAYLAGLEAGRPKWHKVADGDLPKVTGDYITNIGVLTYDHYGNNIYKWHTPFCEACDYGAEVDDDEVIAWCEIPKYTEE